VIMWGKILIGAWIKGFFNEIEKRIKRIWEAQPPKTSLFSKQEKMMRFYKKIVQVESCWVLCQGDLHITQARRGTRLNVVKCTKWTITKYSGTNKREGARYGGR
jgi:hypothetical protein